MNVDEELVDKFEELFAGNRNAWGTEAGGCRKEPVTRALFVDHLYGRTPIGIYPLYETWGTWMAAWGCIDIDFQDFNLALNLQAVLERCDVPAWVEKSRSKGWHVWVLTSDLVPAVTMRAALQAACQIIGYSPKEVNPKQTELDEAKSFGNYVRLPYAHYGLMGGRHFVDRKGTPMSAHEAIRAAYERQAVLPPLERLAGLYRPPKRPVLQQEWGTPSGDLGRILWRLDGVGKAILQGGPLEGSDRSSTLFKLALRCRESGLTPADAHVVVAEGDRRWGKFYGRSDADRRITEIVTNAYG